MIYVSDLPYKVCIFLIWIASRLDLVMFVCLSVLMSVCEWDLLQLIDSLNLDFGLQTWVPKSEYPDSWERADSLNSGSF